MNSADSIKKGLDALRMCHDLMAFNPATGEEIDPALMNADNRELYYGIETVITHIHQLEANWQQVSKALWGKENATLEEVLQVINQVTPRTFAIPPRSGKTLTFQLSQRIAELEKELATVKRERDAAVADLGPDCCTCKHKGETERCRWSPCGYEWRGVCPDTEVQPND